MIASSLTGLPAPLRVLRCRRSCFCNFLLRGLLLGLDLPQPARLSFLAVGTFCLSHIFLNHCAFLNLCPSYRLGNLSDDDCTCHIKNISGPLSSLIVLTHAGCYSALFVMPLLTSPLTTMNCGSWRSHRMQSCTAYCLVAVVLSDHDHVVSPDIGHVNPGVYPPDIGP